MPRGETAAGVRHRAGGANRGSLLRVSDLSNGLPQLFWPQNTHVVGVSTMCLKTRALRALSGPAPGKKMGKKKPGAFQLRAILLQPENSGRPLLASGTTAWLAPGCRAHLRSCQREAAALRWCQCC